MKTTNVLVLAIFMISMGLVSAQDMNSDVEIRVSVSGVLNQIVTSSDELEDSFLNGFESLGTGYELAASIKKSYAGISFRVGQSSNSAISSHWISDTGLEVSSIDDLKLKKFGADLNFYLDLADRFDLEIIMGYVLNFGDDIDYRFDDISSPDIGKVHSIRSAQTRLGLSGLYRLTDRINVGINTEVLTGEMNYQTDTIFGVPFFNEGAYHDPLLNWNTSLVITYTL